MKKNKGKLPAIVVEEFEFNPEPSEKAEVAEPEQARPLVLSETGRIFHRQWLNSRTASKLIAAGR